MNKLLYTTEEVLGTPTLKNYFFSTKAHFDVVMEQSSENLYIGPREVEAKWEDMKQTSGFEFHSSPKSVDSEYLVDVTTGDIYRKSQHWGKISSCEWTTGKHDAKICYRHYCIAKCNIKDFVFRGKIMYLYVDDIKKKVLEIRSIRKTEVNRMPYKIFYLVYQTTTCKIHYPSAKVRTNYEL